MAKSNKNSSFNFSEFAEKIVSLISSSIRYILKLLIYYLILIKNSLNEKTNVNLNQVAYNKILLN
jgi:hypothetical protein